MVHAYRGLLIVLLAVFTVTPAWGQSVTHEQVEKAIDDLQAFLYSQQSPDGVWYAPPHERTDDPKTNKNHGGPTAIATLALITSGESMQEPRIVKSLNWLRQAEMFGTYAVSLRAHVWSYLPPSFMPLLERDAQNLLQTTGALSKFDYYVYPKSDGPNKDSPRGKIVGRTDNSTTQYGVLAIWQAAKRGARIGDKFWENAVVHFLEEQNPDGGWTYSSGESRATMTCAGLTVLYVAQQELYRDRDIAVPEIQASINKGLEWMDKHWDQPGHVHGGNGYYIYGVERVGLASGRKYFGHKDWFKEIATKQVRAVGKNGVGGNVVNSSFILMFLARGNVPIWINKLEIPGYAWNNRPNDIYFLNEFMGKYREMDLGWQQVSIEENSDQWLNAPIMYLSGRDELELSEEQIKNLKKYIDRGGLLWANPERGGSSFQESIRNLAKQMYPELGEMKQIEREHPLNGLIQRGGSSSLNVLALNNGARDFILMPREDWGMDWQKEENPGSGDAWFAAINLYAMALERGVIRPRLALPFEPREEGAVSGVIKVAQIDLDSQAVLEPEPYAFVRHNIFNATKKNVDVVSMTPADLAGSEDVVLAHLSGVQPAEITDAEVDAIVKFAKSGGTVLIENLGGRGNFVDGIETKIASAMGEKAKRVVRSPLTSGQGLTGGEKLDKVVTRPFSILTRGSSAGLSLTQFEVEGRPAIYLSRQDLTLGMLGVRRWGIDGYSPEASRAIMRNLVLLAAKDHAK